MLNLRTAKGSAATASIVAVAMLIAACNPGTGEVDLTFDEPDDPAEVTVGEPTQDEIDAANESGKDQPAESGGDELIFVPSGLDVEDCHDYSTMGGASDGVIVLVLSSEDFGLKVEADVILGDGTTTTVEGVVGEDGRVVLLVPLFSFGEIVEIVEVRVDGTAVDLTGLGELKFTVEAESNCGNHPSAGDE